ncbi:MAG TPA: hypothetical protein VJR29_00755 [bacterium]|nr:hypothetical protein [bacterium]
MNPFLILLALLLAAPALFNPHRPLQARTSAPIGDSASPQALVEAKLLTPLQEKEAKRPTFSRAAPPPSARRVRILDQAPQADTKGRTFISFAIDESHSFRGLEAKELPEDAWHREVIVGCVYPKNGEVIVKLGEAHYPAAVLWGESVGAAPAGVCRRS